MNGDNDILSVAEAAAALDLNRNNVQAWIAKGRLKAKRVGRSWAIKREDLEAFRAWWKGNARAVSSKASRPPPP
jgi:excisionase family DNA binding protein